MPEQVTKLKQASGQLLLVLGDITIGGVLALAAAAWLTNDTFWPAALAINLLPYLLMLTLVTAPAAIISKSPLRLGLNGAAVLVFVVLYGTLFTPQAGANAAQGVPLRVVTFNTLGRSGDPSEVVTVLRAGEADIVALQELHTRTAEHLQRELADLYPYMALYPVDGNGIAGAGVLSRYPIVGNELLHTAGPLPHVRADIAIEGHMVTVFSVHPTPPRLRQSPFIHYDDSLRGADIVAILDEAAQVAGPVLLLGDFNMAPHSADWRAVRQAGFSDGFQRAGRGFGMTFPNGMVIGPVVRIDYVFVSEGVAVHEAWLSEAASADHRLVWADVALQPGP